MELWNTKHLKPPPINSCKALAKEIDIKLLRIAVANGLNFFQNQPHLSTEAALLSRLIYRMKMKMRSAKEFKFIEKLSRVLRTYLQIDIAKELKTLLNSLPHLYKLNKTYIFSKNMMDFVLVRLQGLGKTLDRILETCKVAFDWTQKKLRVGHFWKITIIVYAAIARIFVIARNVLKFTCGLYDDLVPIEPSLGNVGVKWLPEGYVLPERLDQWLDVDWLELDKSVIEIQDDEASFMKLMSDDDDVEAEVEFCDEYILVKDDFSESEDIEFCDESVINLDDFETPKKEKKEEEIVNLCDTLEDVDVGEVINLSDLETPVKKKRKKKSGNFTPKIMKMKTNFKKNKNRRKRYFN